MTKLEKMAAKEFLKLPKKEQKRLNNLKRVPVARPGHEFDELPRPRKKRWDLDE